MRFHLVIRMAGVKAAMRAIRQFERFPIGENVSNLDENRADA
jgi:hypothetical protein